MRAHYAHELETADHVNADHARIAEAIRKGDTKAAEAALSAHLAAIRDRMQTNLERDGGTI